MSNRFVDFKKCWIGQGPIRYKIENSIITKDGRSNDLEWVWIELKKKKYFSKKSFLFKLNSF